MERHGHLLGLLIQSRRQEKDITKGELAGAVGITEIEMNNCETGEAVPNAETLLSIALVLNVEPHYFWDHDIVYIDDSIEVHPADPLTVTRFSDTELDVLLLVQWQNLDRSRRNLAAGHMRVLSADQQRSNFLRVLNEII